MGMGFRLNLKWALPNQCSSPAKSLCRRSSTLFRGREASFDLARVSSLSVISEDGETISRDTLKAYKCSSAALQTLGNDCSELDEMKMNVCKRSRTGSHNMIDDSCTPIEKDNSTFQQNKATHFSLLLENLGILEETIADSNTVRLERDILVQLGRLGALKLFHVCLSRTLKTPSVFDLSDAPTELIGDCQIKDLIDDHTGDAVVSSGKKEERKSRRDRALEKAKNISSLCLPSKTVRKGPGRPTVYSAKRQLNSRRRRLTVTKNEVEMSRGVKVVADLERIRATLEEETGLVASLSSWAEAAGVDKKVLQQHLHFGWHCRDELLRSTHSLVTYLARNYRGMGVAYDDLLQAGNLGILQGAERFDPARGYRFSTYVQYWIRKSMSTLVARHSRGIQIPFAMGRAINQIQKARKAFRNSHGKYPDEDKIAELTGLSLAKVSSTSKCLRVVGSIDQKVGKSLSVKFVECTSDTSIKGPEESVMRQHLKKEIYDLLKDLDPREAQVLVLRYGLGNCQCKSLKEIGRLLQVSKEWIRKIERTALTKLRNKEILRSLSHYTKL